MKKMLNNSCIKALSPGETVWDTEVPGLHVRHLRNAKAFYLFYRTQSGVQRRPKLGDASVLPLGDARAIARSQLAQVATGADPAAERAKARGEPTVAEFFERMWNDHFSRKKDCRNVRRIFDSRVAPRLGNHRVRTVCYNDINGLHRSLEATPVEANRTLALVSKLLNLAERQGERGLNTNPCRHISRYPELSRKRFAKGTELQVIGPLLDKAWATFPDSAAFIGLMLFAGMRPSEVEFGRREWITRVGGVGILHLPGSKNGHARDVHLSAHALGLLDKLPAPPKVGGMTPLVGVKYPRRLWNHIRTEAGCPDLWLYDLRRTFATVSLAAGNPISQIGESLGHRTVQTTKVYARLMDEAGANVAGSTGDKMAGLLTAAPSAPRA